VAVAVAVGVGGGGRPTPVSGTVMVGLLGALVVIVRVPFAVPVVVGAKPTGS